MQLPSEAYEVSDEGLANFVRSAPRRLQANKNLKYYYVSKATMQKRGSNQALLLLLVVGVIAIVSLVVMFKDLNGAVGAQAYGGTVARGTPTKSDCLKINTEIKGIIIDINAVILQIKQTMAKIEALQVKIEKVKLKIDFLLKIKLKINTDIWLQRTTLITCQEFRALYPDLFEAEEDEEGNKLPPALTCDDFKPELTPEELAEKGTAPEDSKKADEEIRKAAKEFPSVLVFKQNVHIVQRITFKLTVRLKLLYERLSIHIKAIKALYVQVQALFAKINIHIEAWNIKDGALKDCFQRASCCEEIPRDRIVTPTPTPTDRIVTPTPREEVPTAGLPPTEAVPKPVDCETACAQKGMSTQKPSSSSILAQLQQYKCVSGASISIKGARVGNCVCYGKPEITIDKKVPVCKTPCGDVPCGSETKCPCPDKPNCVLTARCTWGGWKEIKEYTYQPIVGAKA